MVFSKFFGVDKTPIAGLDISQDYIVLIKLLKEDNVIKLEKLLKIPTPEGTVFGGNITEPKQIGSVIRELLDEHEIENIKVNVALPSNIPFIKTVSLPDLPFEELKIIAQDEASNHLPFPISEANLDYVLLEDTRRVIDGNKKVVDVLIIGVQKSVAQKYIDITDAAKITLRSIDVCTYSMIKGLECSHQIKPGKDITVSVLIGYDSTDITLVSNGMPLFSHQTQVGKKNIIETLATGLGMDHKQTLEFLPNVAVLVPGQATTNDPQLVKAATLVRMIFNTISTEISKAIQFYKTQKANTPEISKILLGGSGMCIMNADIFIGNRLKIETEITDSFRNIRTTPEQLANQDIPTLITPVGLALKGL